MHVSGTCPENACQKFKKNVFNSCSHVELCFVFVQTYVDVSLRLENVLILHCTQAGVPDAKTYKYYMYTI